MKFCAGFFAILAAVCLVCYIGVTVPHTWAYIKSLPWQSWALMGGCLFSTVMSIVFMDRIYK